MKSQFKCPAKASFICKQIFIVLIIISTAWAANPAGAKDNTAESERLLLDLKSELSHYHIAGQTSGYMNVDAFLHFLDRAGGIAETDSPSWIQRFFYDPLSFKGRYGIMPVLMCILVGGIALNLTPCVLPMIPVNLAIIGIGGRSDRVRGFALGGAYGAGMAITYGLLGSAVITTGSHFGSIQSSWWFNFMVAFLFMILGLAMFDLIRIDLTSFQTRLKGEPQNGKGFSTVAAMGGVSALLAGACVAPVVIAVLLLSASMGYSGILLPFVLGLGMAMPWPFVGAGLAILPKPGKWMVYLKYSFGVIIICFSLHYGWLAYRQFAVISTDSETGVQSSRHVTIGGNDLSGLTQVLHRARQEKKPVLMEFRAEWCKNCIALEKRTFTNSAVSERLEGYLIVRYGCDHLSDASTRQVLDHFGVRGLPTLTVLKPYART